MRQQHQTVRSKNPAYQQLIEAPLMSTTKTAGQYSLPRNQAAAGYNVSTTVEAGKKYHLTGVQLTCDRPCYIAITVMKTGSQFNNLRERIDITLGDKDTEIILPYNEMLFEGGTVSLSAVPQSATGEAPFITMRLLGEASSLFALDNAYYKIVVLGDSKALSTLGVNSLGERFYVNQFVTQLASKDRRVSVIDKTIPGGAAIDMVELIRRGGLHGIDYDLLVVAIGTNNANTPPSASIIDLFKSHLRFPLMHRDLHQPDASIIYNTQGVTDKSTWLPNIDAYRQATVEVATDIATAGEDREVFLFREDQAFTVSSTVKSDRFIDTEVLGNQVHYSPLGHDAVTPGFIQVAKKTGFYKKKLGL